MKTHRAGIYQMYLTEKIIKIENEDVKELNLTLYSVNEIKEGDKYCYNRSNNEYNVDKVHEHMFPCKGNHKQDTHWYNLTLKRK